MACLGDECGAHSYLLLADGWLQVGPDSAWLLCGQANATGAATGDRASCSDQISEYAAQGRAVSSSSLEDGGLRAPQLPSVGFLSYPPLSGWGNRMEARQGLIPLSQASLTACAHNSETLLSVLGNNSNNRITSAVCSLSALRFPSLWPAHFSASWDFCLHGSCSVLSFGLETPS